MKTKLLSLLLSQSVVIASQSSQDLEIMKKCYNAPSRNMRMLEREPLKCTIDQEDDNNDPNRITQCGTLNNCKRHFSNGPNGAPTSSNYFDNTQCNLWESCARFDGDDSSSYMCINTKHCNEHGQFPAYSGNSGKFQCRGKQAQFEYPQAYESMNQCIDRQSYNLNAVETHNKYRKLHQAMQLEINEDARIDAQRKAEELSAANPDPKEGDRYQNFGQEVDIGGCGYNIATTSDMKKLYDSDWATEFWYSNVRFYNFQHPGHNEIAKSFIKLTWKDTKVVGFGISGKFVVAKYCKVGEKSDQNYYLNVLPFDHCKESQIKLENGSCKYCPIGYKRDYETNKCVAYIKCGDNEIISDGICVLDCGSDKKISDDGKSCVEIEKEQEKPKEQPKGEPKEQSIKEPVQEFVQESKEVKEETIIESSEEIIEPELAPELVEEEPKTKKLSDTVKLNQPQELLVQSEQPLKITEAKTAALPIKLMEEEGVEHDSDFDTIVILCNISFILAICATFSIASYCIYKHFKQKESSPQDLADSNKETPQAKDIENNFEEFDTIKNEKKKNYFNNNQEDQDCYNIRERATVKKVLKQAEQKYSSYKTPYETHRNLVNQPNNEEKDENNKDVTQVAEAVKDTIRLEDLKIEIESSKNINDLCERSDLSSDIDQKYFSFQQKQRKEQDRVSSANTNKY